MAEAEKATKVDEQKDNDQEEEKWVKYYSSNHEILLVGEGDFSFSTCLAQAFGSASNIVASSLDSYGIFIILLHPLDLLFTWVFLFCSSSIFTFV